MRILYFHQHFSTPAGSTGTRSYAMCTKLIACGHQVTLVCGRYDGGVTGLSHPFSSGMRCGQVDGIDVIEFDLAYSNSLSFFKRIFIFLLFSFRCIKVSLTVKYDILFATSTPLTVALPGIVARWILGKRFVFEVRDLWPELPRAMGVIRNPILLWFLDSFETLSYRSANKLIGLSPGIVKGISSKGVANNRIIAIPNGCDLDLFSIDLQYWRPANVHYSDFMAVFSGTHGEANGLDAVLSAASVLKKRQLSNIKIILIGQGKLKSKLLERAKHEALDNVIFHDPVTKGRLAGLMSAADLGLQVLANIPSFYYGTSPNKFFDYISAGLPVLNNYPGWISDLIGQHQCGFSVPPDDPEAFADALEFAAANSDALKIMGYNARKLAETQFDRNILSDAWVEWVTEE